MGTISIYRSLAYVITGGFPVLGVPRDYRNVFNLRVNAYVTIAVLIFFLFAILMTILLKKRALARTRTRRANRAKQAGQTGAG